MHVPYRNSMMTSVLRDSLGGNCMTTMIATCSIEKKNLDVTDYKNYLKGFEKSKMIFKILNEQESISTCRFAQRVALIKNEALINEELDPKLIINRLKKEVEELKNQLSISNNGLELAGDLSQHELKKYKIL